MVSVHLRSVGGGWSTGQGSDRRRRQRPGRQGHLGGDFFVGSESTATNWSCLLFWVSTAPLRSCIRRDLSNSHGKYKSSGVVFIAVDSNRQDSVTEIGAFARRHEITFQILKDLRQTIANRLGATRTPQIVVLDRERRIRYRGRIDDQFGFMPTNRTAGYHKPKPERKDLQCAIDELLAGKPVSVTETQAAGCLIGRDREPAAHPSFTYAKDVAPILNKRCVTCHRPQQIAPFALTSYEEVAGWADMIAEVTELNRMPPWHADPNYGSFLNDCAPQRQGKTHSRRMGDRRGAAGRSEGFAGTANFC